MREGNSSQVNGGLLIARATPRMLRFWERIVAEFIENPTVELGEQTLMNSLLQHPSCDLRWDFLAREMVAWATLLPAEDRDTHDICFHHAVCADGVEAKGAQMDCVAARILRAEHAPDLRPVTAEPVPPQSAHIVLCRYREDGQGISRWLGHPNSKVFVYDRGEPPLAGLPPGVVHIRCENVGREGYVYLQHIVEHYGRLPQVVLFSQFDRDSHPAPPIRTMLAAHLFVSSVFNVGLGFLAATRWTEGEEQGFGYIEFPQPSHWRDAWLDGSMTRSKYSLGSFYDEFVGHPRPPIGRCVTTLGGTFAAGYPALMAHPRVYYQRLQSTLAGSEDPEEGHLLERVWAHVFLGPNAALCAKDRALVLT